MKTCNKCGQSKPATSEYFQIKTKKRKSGEKYSFFTSPCRACHCNKQKERFLLGGEQARLHRNESRRRQRAVYGRDRTNEYQNKKLKRAGGQEAYEQKQRDAALKKFHSVLVLLRKKKQQIIPRKGLANGVCWLWDNPALSKGEAYKLRYRLDPEFNINERVRGQFNKKRKRDGIGTLMREALKRGGTSNQVQTLLGYSISELRAHLESKFTKGMTWEMFCLGEIHIDHIRPQSAFDLTRHSEWVKCWSLDNLQPLWAADNLAKSNKLYWQ